MWASTFPPGPVAFFSPVGRQRRAFFSSSSRESHGTTEEEEGEGEKENVW